MKQLFLLAAELDQFLREKGWKYCFIGGLALQRWGEPRVTMDVDLTLWTGLGEEGKYIDEFLSRYGGRRGNAKTFALANRVLLLESPGKIGIDVALAGFDFENRVIARATPFEFIPGKPIVTCSAEDLVILKAFADRERDWVDIRGILVRQKGRMDWHDLQNQLTGLCELKEAPEIPEKLQRLYKTIK